ncbi:hypothetical protein RND81_03G004600 [Saponaria officinalis]|uniref:TFIIS N-terminal domain-containing protein n=1 Tax=Saponaria officinalis TaxID=3572 RepID=A0AAW1M2M7_SAPOF
MTLEDFFTLTEMKDGLTAPARVLELVSVMKEKDGVVKNIGDTTRQWAAVASTIAATESKECIDLFIQLDGLWYIDKWLKDAQSFANEDSTCSVEEAISALLQAVEKLQMDDEKLVSSGIYVTVKGLLRYKSPKVQDKARALFNTWKLKNIDIKSMDVENAEASDDPKKISEHPESQVIADDASIARIPVDQKSNATGGENIKSTDDQESSHTTFCDADIKDKRPDSVASPVKLDSVVKDLSVKEEVLRTSDGNSDSQILASPNQDTCDVRSEKCELVGEVTRDGDKLGNLSDDVDIVEASSSRVLSGTDITAVEEAITHPDASTYERCDRVLGKCSSFDDTNRPIDESTNESRLEDVDKDDGRSLERKGSDKGIGSILVETKDQEIAESRLEEVGKSDEANKQQKSKKKRFGRRHKFERLTKSSKNSDLIQQTANMDIEDGTFDALEVARLVANEVEREVVNYEEQSVSSSSYASSEEISTGGISQPDSPKSIIGEQDLETNSPVNECLTMENVPLRASEKHLISSATMEKNPENHLQDMESSQLTVAAKDPGITKQNSFLEFDLNQEFSSEDIDHNNQVDAFSNPVSVVSASKAVVAPALPAGPLKFEGSLGWKGSAATSAFRPASPRRTFDSNRAALSGGATSSGSRQRQDYLNIDLNVAGGDLKAVNHMSGKEKQILPLAECSFELSSKQSGRLTFDLNQIEEDGNPPAASQWMLGGNFFGSQKSRRSPSPASSSSCVQPLTRNFDLNDNPSNGNDPSDIHPFLWGSSSNRKANPFVANQESDSAVSILGTKVQKSSFPTQTPLHFPNGRAGEPSIDINLFRGPLMGSGPSVPYPQSSYGYNGLAMGPSVSFPSAPPIYGSATPVPYVFDTRGHPFAPHIVGATSAVPPSSYSQPSLLMNMVGPTHAPNFGSQFYPNADLNSGYRVDSGNNRDPAFFQQLFAPDQFRNSFIPLSSGSTPNGGKRKEPESGWELFPNNYKHHQPPHL